MDTIIDQRGQFETTYENVSLLLKPGCYRSLAVPPHGDNWLSRSKTSWNQCSIVSDFKAINPVLGTLSNWHCTEHPYWTDHLPSPYEWSKITPITKFPFQRQHPPICSVREFILLYLYPTIQYGFQSSIAWILRWYTILARPLASAWYLLHVPRPYLGYIFIMKGKT